MLSTKKQRSLLVTFVSTAHQSWTQTLLSRWKVKTLVSDFWKPSCSVRSTYNGTAIKKLMKAPCSWHLGITAIKVKLGQEMFVAHESRQPGLGSRLTWCPLSWERGAAADVARTPQSRHQAHPGCSGWQCRTRCSCRLGRQTWFSSTSCTLSILRQAHLQYKNASNQNPHHNTNPCYNICKYIFMETNLIYVSLYAIKDTKQMNRTTKAKRTALITT